MWSGEWNKSIAKYWHVCIAGMRTWTKPFDEIRVVVQDGEPGIVLRGIRAQPVDLDSSSTVYVSRESECGPHARRGRRLGS